MKIERISENQIRCTLTSFDLSVRNLNLGELAYGSEKARKLFREMIQKASNEVGFEAEDTPLMVEAIPLSNESVMLLITKIEDPEELDTRFAKFSSGAEDDSMISDLTSEILEGADSLLDYLKSNVLPGAVEEGTASSEPQQQEETSALNSIRVFTFGNLDAVIDAAKVASPLFSGNSTLYKKPETGQYYLVIKRCPDSQEFSRVCNVLAEYGNKIRHNYASESYFEEHYETIIAQNALQALGSL